MGVDILKGYLQNIENKSAEIRKSTASVKEQVDCFKELARTRADWETRMKTRDEELAKAKAKIGGLKDRVKAADAKAHAYHATILTLRAENFDL